MTPIHALAVETDTALAALHDQRAKSLRSISWAIESQHSIAGHRRRNGVYVDSLDGVDTAKLTPWQQRDWSQAVERIAVCRSEVARLDESIDACEAVWQENGRWSRFFLVQNVGGHIHSSLNCSTCRWDTSFAWLPTLSGLTEAEAVEAHGSILCSVCFPSAPVEWTQGESLVSQQAKAERAAAKQARDAAKLAKALLPDGSPLTVQEGRYSTDIVTLASAKTWLTDSYDGYRNRDPESLRAVAEAIAAKLGTTAADEIAAAKARAAKRR